MLNIKSCAIYIYAAIMKGTFYSFSFALAVVTQYGFMMNRIMG